MSASRAPCRTAFLQCTYARFWGQNVRHAAGLKKNRIIQETTEVRLLNEPAP